jgi:hypothetical protein
MYRRRQMTRRLLVLAALVAPAAGCGGDATLAPQEYPGTAEQLVTRSEVAHLNSDSPAYALLTWWRSSQYAERAAFLQGFARVLANELSETESVDVELEYFAGSIRVAKPEVTEVDLEDGRATVYTLIRFHQPVGSTRFVTSTKPQAFPMVWQRNSWRLADDHFFRSITAPLRTGTSAGN